MRKSPWEKSECKKVITKMNSMLKDGKSVEEIRQEFVQDYIDFEIDEMLQKLQLAGAKNESRWTKLYKTTGAILSVLLIAIIGYIAGAEATGKVEVLNIWSSLVAGLTIVAILGIYISSKNLIGYTSSIFAILLMSQLGEKLPVVFGGVLGTILLILVYILAIILFITMMFVPKELDYRIAKIRKVLKEAA